MAMASMWKRSAQKADRLGGLDLSLLGEVGEDRVVVQELSLPVEADDLAARAEAGVDGQDVLLPQRGRQQQLPQVVGKDPDGRLVGALLRLEPGLRLHGPAQQALVAVVDGFPHLLRGRALPL